MSFFEKLWGRRTREVPKPSPEDEVRRQLDESAKRLGELALIVTREEGELLRMRASQKADEEAVANWTRQAEAALTHDREDVARTALVHKREAQQRLEEAPDLIERQRSLVGELKRRYGRLEEEINAAQREYEELLHRGEVASASLRASKSVEAFHSLAFEDEVNKIRQTIAEDEAKREVERLSRTHLDEELDALEQKMDQAERAKSEGETT